MPSSRQSSSSSRHATQLSPLLARVPRQLGYAAYLDSNETEVFTRLDMARADHRDVVPFNRVELLTVMMGRRAKCIDGINPTIYYYKNSHSHMIKSHDWLVQLTPTH